MTIQFNILSLLKIKTTEISIKKIKLHLNSLSETYKTRFLKDLNKAKKEEGFNEQVDALIFPDEIYQDFKGELQETETEGMGRKNEEAI